MQKQRFIFLSISSLQSKSKWFSRRHRESECQVRVGLCASNTHTPTHTHKQTLPDFIRIVCLPLSQCFCPGILRVHHLQTFNTQRTASAEQTSVSTHPQKYIHRALPPHALSFQISKFLSPCRGF